MIEDQARKLEVPTKWNGKANVCIYCGRVPETFYIVTGHDHTDDSIRWCVCRESGQYKDEITTLHQRVQELEKEAKQLRDLQYELMRSGALVAIEKCKNATGQRRVIDMYVSANQIAEDLLNAMDSGA